MYEIIECKISYPNKKIYLIWNSATGVFPTDRFYTSRDEAEIAKKHLGPPEGYLKQKVK